MTTHPAPAQASWEALGTRVVLRLTDGRALERARPAVARELVAIDSACSRFRPDSELSRLNASGGRAMRIGPLFAEALSLALRAAALTGGDVDPTVGRALVLAGYDRDWSLMGASETAEAAREVPQTAARARARVRARAPRNETDETDETAGTPPPAVSARFEGGWRTIHFDPEGPSVRLPVGIALDLGASAKAWAADRAVRVAADSGACGALVSIGGDIALAGPAPARGWPVRVTDDHRAAPTAEGQTVTIRSGGLATSTTTVRRWHDRGRAMHHILDPATGAPAQGSWRTVSVAAGSCADANIATTAALVRGDRAPDWLTGLGLPARLVGWDGQVLHLGDWPAQRDESPRPAELAT
ncbi:MAG TPA: FAD:protein FMN transferase [Solirubrobacteraceae bacterium]|nr:FAD:protein FMN transferase [Solirubrobacteraceae bacterium]